MSTQTDSTDRQPAVWLALLVAILPVVATSLIGSAATVPQIPGWYAGLAKPPFNPPNWLFAPVWTTLFALMGLAVFRVLRRPSGTISRSRALLAYHVQLALNLVWSCVFFGLNSPAGGLVVIALLIAAILWTIRCFAALPDRFAAWLLAPYLAWVSFAAVLNLSIWWLNR
ncbi:TspO/MBR family protein [Bosea sp. (in: a-proteobacteria)]|uniref:TspO/MBR family protein n=1 Tax=Bosea sp. (in: a-proteobacteria) TaxID=1871050 RepID=UPI002FCB81EA